MSELRDLPKGSDLFVEAFARGLAVIKAFGPQHEKLTLSEVAARASVTPATARRLLHTLVTLGYANFDGRWFTLRPAVLEIGHAYLGSLTLREAALPCLDAFTRTTGEICTVSVLDRHEVLYVARTEIRSPISRRLTVGERLPAYATSSGQVLLGSLPALELERYLDSAVFTPLTERTLVTRDAIAQAVAQAKERGYAMASEQLELGVCGLAVPITDRAGQTVAALTTSLSLIKHPLESLAQKFVPQLQAIAAEIGQGMMS